MVRWSVGLDALGAWLVRGRKLNPAEQGRLQFLISCVSVGALMGLVSVPLELLDHGRYTGLIGVVTFVVATVGLLSTARLGVSLPAVEAAELVVLTLFLTFMSLQGGVFHVEQLYWLSLLPLSGGLMLGRVGVWLGSALALLAGLWIALFHQWGWTFEGPAEASPVLSFANFALFVVSVGLLAGLYEFLRSRAVDRAEQAAQARADFLANISHELRTPMNGVIGMTQVLDGTPLNPEQHEHLALIRRSGEAMVDIINDLLDFSKLEAGQLRIEAAPTSVRDVLADVVQLFIGPAAARGVRLESTVDAAVPEWLTSDPLRLRQVLHNLVSNAVKFSRQGAVRVALAWSDGVLRGSVEDDGQGMSVDLMSRLFTPFEQGDASTARQHGGTGLGLAITRKLCRGMGGEVLVESEFGVGSCFTFTCRCPHSLEGVAPRAPTGDLAALHGRVLLVEDNPVNQLVARKLCERFGLEVHLAEQGAQALECVAREPFALVLMDCQMPVMDGYEATRRIRSLPGLQGQVPVIALTASALPDDLQRCRDAGMNETLSKPVDAAKLREVLGRYLA